MKSFNILLVFLVLLMSCKNKQKPAEESENVQIEKKYASFGKLIVRVPLKKSFDRKNNPIISS